MLSVTPHNSFSAKSKPPITLVDFTTLNRRNKDTHKQFSSSRPNHVLTWALIDDGKIETDSDKDSDHDLAVSYIDGWKPAPWKGQIWRAPKRNITTVSVAPCVDLIWSGRDWMPYTGREVIDKPFTYPERSRTSIELIEKVAYTKATTSRRAPRITDEDLNAAYIRYSLDPIDEEENLKVTMYAYIRGTYIRAQIRKLLSGKHEIAIEEDDLVMKFIGHLLSMLPDYKHDGRMHCWVKLTWKRFFFPDEQRQVIEYTNAARWINEVDPKSKKYKHLIRCVSYFDLTTDTLDVGKASPENRRFSKELLTSDPKSPWFQLSDSSKEMLQARLRGETNKQTAKRLGCTPQHIGRLLEAAKAEAKQINAAKAQAKQIHDGGGL